MTNIAPARTVDDRSQLAMGTLVAAALAVAVAQMALSIPAVLNGLFQQDLGTTSTQLTWISDAFLVPVTLLELSFGVMGDLFGRKRLLAIGAALLAAGALLAFFTPGSGTSHGVRVAVLLTGQALAGVGAAAIFPTSVAMLAAGTHTVRARSHAISVWAAALTGAGFISPVLGGLLARIGHSGGPDASWRWALLALAVLAAVSAAVTLTAAANSSAPAGRALDWPGQITVAAGVFALLFGVIQGSSAGYGSGLVLSAFAVAVVFLALFVVIEQRRRRPLIGFSLFANRIFAASAVVTVIGMFAYLVAGAGFKLAVTSITVVAVNSVPTPKAGMASGATSMLRDFGLTLGPAVVGAIALTQAAHQVSAKLSASPGLRAALAAFNAAPAHAPAAERASLAAAVGAVNSGPLGANGVPATITLPNGHLQPFNPLKDVAFHALSSAYSVGYLVCGIAALAAALVAALLIGGRPHHAAFLDTE